MEHLHKVCGNVPLYAADGGGRDTYILENHGGYSKISSKMPSCFKTGNRFSKFSPPKPRVDGKMHKYVINGSGRDTYIHLRDSINSEQSFKLTLRTYSKN